MALFIRFVGIPGIMSERNPFATAALKEVINIGAVDSPFIIVPVALDSLENNMRAMRPAAVAMRLHRFDRFWHCSPAASLSQVVNAWKRPLGLAQSHARAARHLSPSARNTMPAPSKGQQTQAILGNHAGAVSHSLRLGAASSRSPWQRRSHRIAPASPPGGGQGNVMRRASDGWTFELRCWRTFIARIHFIGRLPWIENRP